jgi:hypothetical protein
LTIAKEPELSRNEQQLDEIGNSNVINTEAVSIGDCIVVKYAAGNKGVLKYFAGVICDKTGTNQFEVKVLKCNRRSFFILDDKYVDDVTIDSIINKIAEPQLNNRGQYTIKYSSHHLE